MDRSAGFTLVETVVALGLVAALMLTILGLLPGGLEAIRHASRPVTIAVVLDGLRARCLAGAPEGDYWCDRQGRIQAAPDGDTCFIIHVRPGNALAVPGDVDGTILSWTVEFRSVYGGWNAACTLVPPPS